MQNSFHDLETRSPTPIKDGTHRYAEEAEILLWAYALEDAPVQVWDVLSGAPMPGDLADQIDDPETLVWFHNGGQFDFVVLKHAMPNVLARIDRGRWRDTMVQAYCHSLPGGLEALGEVLQLGQDKRKLKTGKALMRFFCIPQKNKDDTPYFNHPADHAEKWQQFVEYAGQDVEAMRAAHRKMPTWNYKGAELALWHLDLAINGRGVAVDQDLARAAVRAASQSLAKLAERTNEITDGDVGSTTQRDAMLAHILERHAVTLPNMQADTLKRRRDDENLPIAVRELIDIRLQASMNSASKYTALLKGVSSDGRLRGLAQFCGASRTGRWAHRMFQPGNMMRPPIAAIAEWHGITKNDVKEHHIHDFVNVGIQAMLAGAEDLTHSNVRALTGAAVRGSLVAPEGKKLVVADLANIEGRVAAWLAGEEWKLQAFRDFDTVIGVDGNGKEIRKGPDLYNLSYAKAFNVAHGAVSKDQRQIGKVQSLMFQYGGGVGAWITGAATYSIDLDAMTEAVYGVLPDEVITEAQGFLAWLYQKHDTRYRKTLQDVEELTDLAGISADSVSQMRAVAATSHEAAKLKERHGLTEKVFVTCDSLKRLWRAAHPRTTSYWKELEDTVREAIRTPGVTFAARRLKIRCDGAWLRIGLPSGRALCYPKPKIEKNDSITYAGINPYTRQWGRVHTYAGKVYENVVQAVARDQLAYCLPIAEEAGYATVLTVHDELVSETPNEDRYTVGGLSCILCSNLGWNDGLPLAAAGFECYRYYKG